MAWETLALDSREAIEAELPDCVYQDEIQGRLPSTGGFGTDERSEWSQRQGYEVDLGGGVVAASYRAVAEPIDYESLAGAGSAVAGARGADSGAVDADASDSEGSDGTTDDPGDVARARGTRAEWLERLESAQVSSRRVTTVAATQVSKVALAAQQADQRAAEVVVADPGLSKEGDDAGGAGGDTDVTPDGSATERRWGRGRYGTRVGSAVHAVLQHVDLAANAERGDHERLNGLEQLIEAETSITHARQQAVVEQLLTQALSSDVVLRAGRGRHYQELYVGAPIDAADGSTVTVEGFIDLLYECPETGNLVVVDYKTDAVDASAADPADDTVTGGAPDGSAGDDVGDTVGAGNTGSASTHLNRSLEERLSYYTPQGATYAHCVQQATGRAVERVEFLFISATGTETGTIEGDQLREALAALPILVEAASTAD